MITAEHKVKSIYPDADIKMGWVSVCKEFDWEYGPPAMLHTNKRFIKGVWVRERCLVYGGKYEHLLWRRAWKKLQLEMLKKLEK